MLENHSKNALLLCRYVFQRSLSTRCLGKAISRKKYPRMYKAMVVNQDGSSFFIRHKQPIKLIQMPVDMNKLTEREKRLLWLERKGQKEESFEDNFEDAHTHDNYKELWKL